jgi:REP element-mobilizing transposase RayT
VRTNGPNQPDPDRLPVFSVAWALLPAAPTFLSVPGSWLRRSAYYRHSIIVTFHQRRLPHFFPSGSDLFVSWHLHGSLPHSVYPPDKLLTGDAFAWVDHHLDRTRQGPLFLQQPAIAQIVVDSIQKGESLGHYQLHAFVVMPNHVHLLLAPHVTPSRLLKPLKGCTAREANRILGRTGEPFWQRESYDHWVRGGAEFERIRRYIENNPVKAGLVAQASDYPWSSAAKAEAPGIEKSLDAANKSVHATIRGSAT